jgi:hypothetical protein
MPCGGWASNRRIAEADRSRAVKILSQDVYRGFGPTLATEHLNDRHDLEVGRETVRQWMIAAKLWRAHPLRVEKVHQWRERRSRFGDLVQWDTSIHAWLEGRGEEMVLINMIDDATGRWLARFVSSDSTVENMNVLERYLKERAFEASHDTAADQAGERQRVEEELRSEEVAENLAGGARLRRQARGASMRAEQKANGQPGKSGPATSRFVYPKPPLRNFTKAAGSENQNPQNGQHKARFDWGLGAVCFGARSVASALDLPQERDFPESRIHTSMPSPAAPSKQDISTWL